MLTKKLPFEIKERCEGAYDTCKKKADIVWHGIGNRRGTDMKETYLCLEHALDLANGLMRDCKELGGTNGHN